jgi:CelD/BcsL family acetyltransferase involved in cellulose biosynthesis
MDCMTAEPRVVAKESLSGSAPLKVEEGNSRSEFAALESEWNTLAESCGAGPFQRHECIRAWIQCFASEARLVILTARDPKGRLAAALPLIARWDFVCGVPVPLLEGTANTHSCRFDMIASNPKAAGTAFLRFLRARGGWAALRLIDVAEGGSAWEIYRAAEAASLPVGAWESERSPYLSLPSSYAAILATKSPLFRANLRRRRRQLERLGTLVVERVTDASVLPQRLDEGLALEQRGWKGKQGTAIAQEPQTRAFYVEWAKALAGQGHLSLFFLRLNGKAIAFHYGLVHDGVYYVPKLAYDDSLKGCSPGLVLLEEALKDAIARGLRSYDFLGAEADWKNRWSSSVRANHWLFVFRNTRFGRTLRKAKFEWLPAARNVLFRPEKSRMAQ